MWFSWKVSWYCFWGGFDFEEVDRWVYDGLIYMETVVYRCNNTGIEKRTVHLGKVDCHDFHTFFHKKYDGTKHLELVRSMKKDSSYLLIWDKIKI